MNIKLKAYSTSLLLHLLFLFLLSLITTKQIENRRVIEIDLSLSYPVREEAPRIKEEERQENPPQSPPIKEGRIMPKEEAKPLQRVQKMEDIPTKKERATETFQAMEPSESKMDSKASVEAPQETLNPTGQTKVSGISNPSENTKSEGNVSNNPNPSESKKQVGIIDKRQSQELYLREKLSIISSLVQKQISYPPLARKMGWEGRVVVCFTLYPDGRLENLHIEKSSGYDLLDKNAIDTVKRVAHLFPTPPVEVVVKLPISYRLE